MIYRDKSVGNLIRISVVKLVLLKAGMNLAIFIIFIEAYMMFKV